MCSCQTGMTYSSELRVSWLLQSSPAPSVCVLVRFSPPSLCHTGQLHNTPNRITRYGHAHIKYATKMKQLDMKSERQ